MILVFEICFSCTKLHLETVLRLKSGVLLSSASWPNTLIVKGSRHMLIMRYDTYMHTYDAKGRAINCFNFCINVTAKKKDS